jgi:hypothetical protein
MATTGKVSTSRRIRFISIPNGTSPIEIRVAWVGLEVSLVATFPDQLKHLESSGILVVTREEAVRALNAAKKKKAVDYWMDHCPGGFFCFKPDCCRVVSTEAEVAVLAEVAS